MRWGVLFILSIVAGGCATQAQQRATTLPAARTYEPAQATALVFAPPISNRQAPLNLSREGRDTQAFIGFEQTTITVYSVWSDDRQTNDFCDRYERRAVSQTFGVSQR